MPFSELLTTHIHPKVPALNPLPSNSDAAEYFWKHSLNILYDMQGLVISMSYSFTELSYLSSTDLMCPICLIVHLYPIAVSSMKSLMHPSDCIRAAFMFNIFYGARFLAEDSKLELLYLGTGDRFTGFATL